MSNNSYIFKRNNPIEIAFYFFNHSVLGRSYSCQPRKIRDQSLNFTCFGCGKSIKGYVLDSDKNIVCHSCLNKSNRLRLSDERAQNIQTAQDSAAEFKELLDNCEKKGTCDILTSHHELMKNDNDRLRTDFLLKLVCKNEYEDKWDQIKKDARSKIENAQSSSNR